jgi:LuxR family maltose regulon positive regulatory protein
MEQLLATKLFIPPTRPELVPRPRLIDQLNASAYPGCKLILISAPAGFGKTTLVSEWVQAMGRATPPMAIAWLSLDEGDNDPTRFLAYFIAALNQAKGIEAEIGKGSLSMLQSPQPPPTKAVLTTLINEIASIPDRMILVLDDYHVIESTQVDDMLTFVLEYLPPQIHLVIATREDPHLPLPRLRARGQMTELRAANLRFTSAEAAEFLNQTTGLSLSTEEIAALETRTEGWIAGLQLAAISMRGRDDAADLIKSFTGSHRYVLDYLIEEVLNRQTQHVQNFLLQTAILNRLTGSLCDTVTDQKNSQAILEMLARANLFIVPLEEEHRWYRYHHLFADLLRQRLRQTTPEQVPELQIRASKWFEKNELIDEAIEYSMRAEAYERSAQLIEEHVSALWQRNEHGKLQHWLALLPIELIYSKPQLCVFQAMYQFPNGQLKEANLSLQAIEQALESNHDRRLESPNSDQEALLSDKDERRLRGQVAAIRAFMASYTQEDMQKVIQHARQALEYLTEQELAWRSPTLITLGDAYESQGQMVAAHKVRLEALATGKASGDTYIFIVVNLRLAEILRQQGKLQQVIGICEHMMKKADESGISETPLVGLLLGIWGEVLAEINDLDRAIDLTKKGVKLTARGGDVWYNVLSNLYLVRVLFSSGDIPGVEDVIHSMENTARESVLYLLALHQLSAWQARSWLVKGKLEIASRWAGERELDPDAELTYLHEMENITYARILIAQKQFDEAIGLLQRLLEATEIGGRISRMIEILTLQALVYQAKGEPSQAISTLEQAINLAGPEGFIRTFVDEGLPMARLLYEALDREIAPDYVRRLLAAFPVTKPKGTASIKSQVDQSELIEPLSEREIEVLQLIAKGLTNRVIATRLVLSVHTVKTHSRNIYGKLGVNNRTQAVNRARSLGILPPI